MKGINEDEQEQANRPPDRDLLGWRGGAKGKPEGPTSFYIRSSRASEAGTAACPSSKRRGAGRQLDQWCGQIETLREEGWRCKSPHGKLLAAHNKACAVFLYQALHSLPPCYSISDLWTACESACSLESSGTGLLVVPEAKPEVTELSQPEPCTTETSCLRKSGGITRITDLF